MNKKKFLIFVIFLCFNNLSAQDSIPNISDWEAVTLLGITGVNDVFSDSTECEAALGGGMEMVRMFSTQIYPNLKPCSEEIHFTLMDWIKLQNLYISEDILENNKVTIQAWQPDYEGLFELKYKCTSDGSYARSWIKYYTKTGKDIEVETVLHLYEKYKISELWNQIQKSIGCSLD